MIGFKHLFVATLFLFQLNQISSKHVTIKKLFECEKPIENNAINMELKEDPARVDIVYESDLEVSDTDMVEVRFHQKIGDILIKNVVEYSASLNSIEENFPDALKMCLDQANPKIEGLNISPGKYEWKDFRIKDDEFELIEGVTDGLFQSEITIYTDDTPLLCMASEIVID